LGSALSAPMVPVKDHARAKSERAERNVPHEGSCRHIGPKHTVGRRTVGRTSAASTRPAKVEELAAHLRVSWPASSYLRRAGRTEHVLEVGSEPQS
jgi:hypothetical protein